MVIDRLTKERHYTPCTTDENGTTAEATAYLLLNNVWKLHGLPLSLTLDRGPQFISGVWKNLCKILAIKVHLSTAFHPETDGQSEIADQEMERHLRTFVLELRVMPWLMPWLKLRRVWPVRSCT